MRVCRGDASPPGLPAEAGPKALLAAVLAYLHDSTCRAVCGPARSPQLTALPRPRRLPRRSHYYSRRARCCLALRSLELNAPSCHRRCEDCSPAAAERPPQGSPPSRHAVPPHPTHARLHEVACLPARNTHGPPAPRTCVLTTPRNVPSPRPLSHPTPTLCIASVPFLALPFTPPPDGPHSQRPLDRIPPPRQTRLARRPPAVLMRRPRLDRRGRVPSAASPCATHRPRKGERAPSRRCN